MRIKIMIALSVVVLAVLNYGIYKKENVTINDGGKTARHGAAREQPGNGADVNTRNNEEKTALYKAAQLYKAVEVGDTDTVRELLKHGADVNTRNNEEKTALYKAAQLYKAAEGGDTDTVRELLKHGADVNARDDYNGDAALHAATYLGGTGIGCGTGIAQTRRRCERTKQ